MGFDVLKWLQDAPVKLVAGVGDPNTGGCWMSALSVYSGDTWSDHPDCVCPIIRRLCIRINDMLPSDEARGEVIQPHILEPVGTRTDDEAIIEQRRWHLVDAAVRRFAPYALRKAGLDDNAKALESLPTVTKENWQQARSECRAAYAYAADADADAADAADTAAYAADAAAAGAAYAAAAYAADAAAGAAYAADAAYAAVAAAGAAYAADAADAARVEFAKTVCIPVVLELCQIGSKVPVEPACSERDIKRSVQVTI